MRCRVAREYGRRVAAATEFVSDACKRPAERGLLVLVLEEENADTTRGADSAEDASILVVVFVIVVEDSIIIITLMAATQNSNDINSAARLGLRRIFLRGLDRVLVHVFLFLLLLLFLLQLFFLLLTILSSIR